MPKQIQPVHRRQITKATIDRLLSMIRDGYWLPGERLPAQRELAEALGVGMSTLREALQSLQTMGILEMRHGEGTFVTNHPNDMYDRLVEMSLAMGETDLQMLFEAREILETGFAFYAAIRATDEQIDNLFDILEKERVAIESGMKKVGHNLDLAFHRLIAEIVSNKFLAQIDDTLFNALEELFHVLPQTLEGWHWHYEVAVGIRNRDPFQASEAMRTLIEASAAHYLPHMKLQTTKQNLTFEK
ncbi:MAG: FadR/GntR family transcriptional regulator [Anaerolineaceae bacterium]|jgi:GntR family transcriptional repressor for pyruvate dehydrogenase complex|nr:FadR/GntR family transcriptional regulator [Anaerolineaceae bacterium]